MLKSIKDKYRIRFGQTHNYADIQDNVFCQALDELNEDWQQIDDANNILAKELIQENKELREQLEKGCCRDDDMCQILQENIAIKAELQELKVDLSQVRDSMSIYRDENKGLREQAEIDRMKLCACGVIAMANTRESAKRMRTMHKDYKSAACDDVALAVDREMELREQLDCGSEDEGFCPTLAKYKKPCWRCLEKMDRKNIKEFVDKKHELNKQIADLKAELQEAKKFIGGQSYSTGTQEGE